MTHLLRNVLKSSDASGAESDQKSEHEFSRSFGLEDHTKGNINLNLLHLILVLYKFNPLENDEAALTRVLDWLDKTLKDKPELRDVFRRHAVAAIARQPVDPQKHMADPAVAKEIREQVTLKWADFRDNPDPARPWTTNPVLFVSHVYRVWIERGMLKLAHLRHDMPLYNRYTRWIRENPADALPLDKIVRTTDPTGHSFRRAALRPYIPVNALTPKQLEAQRTRKAAQKRRKRNPSADLPAKS